MQPKTYELLGLAMAGTCLGFLLPFWVPDVVGTVIGQATILVRMGQNISVDEYVGIGFWVGTLLVCKGFIGRWRQRQRGGRER